MLAVKIASHAIGPDQPCFVIAEAGVNHNGSLEMAHRLVDVAVQSGADAVKFQTFKAEKVVTPSAPKAAYQQQTTGVEDSQLDMIKRLELSYADFEQLKDYCDARGIVFLSTPFDEESADFLENLGVPAFKIASGEITNFPFLEYIARKQRPIILSTGMSYLSEVDEAVRVIREAGCQQLILLHCVSNYPAMPPDVNLRAMQTMAQAFQLPVGYSDHTLGNEIAVAALAMGANVLEKHFTLDRNLPGPDHQASLEPAALTALVTGVRLVEQALGDGCKQPAASESDTAIAARRSLVAAQNIAKDSVLTEAMIAIKRPGHGLPPSALPYVVGRRLNQDAGSGELFRLDMFI